MGLSPTRGLRRRSRAWSSATLSRLHLRWSGCLSQGCPTSRRQITPLSCSRAEECCYPGQAIASKEKRGGGGSEAKKKWVYLKSASNFRPL